MASGYLQVGPFDFQTDHHDCLSELNNSFTDFVTEADRALQEVIFVADVLRKAARLAETNFR